MKTLVEEANRIADQFAPCLLAGANRTLVVIVCDDQGWNMCLRGSRAHATLALDAALDDVRNNDGAYKPYNPVSA